MAGAGSDAALLAQFVPKAQLRFTRRLCLGEEGDFFKGKLAELAETIRAMPVVYGQDGKGEATVVHLHYFAGSADWYITEKDSEAEQLQAFGLADLFGDGGELGYISIEELVAEAGVEIDYHWTPKTLAEVRASRRR